MSTCYDCGQNECDCVSPEVRRLRQELDEAQANTERLRGWLVTANAEINAAKAERDALARKEQRVYDRINTWNDDPVTRLQMLALTAERVDGLEADAAYWKSRTETAEAERDRMLPVVEAAEAWRAGWGPDWMRALTVDGRRKESRVIDLIAAVDAYRSSAPVIPDPEEKPQP